MGVKVKERKPGEFWIYICHHGKRTAKKVGAKKAAMDVKKIIEAKIALNDFGITDEQERMATFKSYSLIWLNSHVKTTCRDGTYSRYKSLLEKYIHPQLGTMPLDQINRSTVRDFLAGQLKKPKTSSSAICLMKDVISGVMTMAMEDELIKANPTQGILKRLKISRKREIEIEPLTPEEVALFLQACKEIYPEHFPIFLTAFRTGLRLGELLALEWGDIDWHNKLLVVKKSYRRKRVTSTKTNKTRRVDMSDQTIDTLKSLYIQRQKEALRSGRGEPVSIIFHRKNTYMEQNYIRRVFKRILLKAGLREIRVHDARHTFASLLLTNNESPAYVKDQLGHTNISMTVDTYGHLIPGANRSAVNRLDETPAKPEKKEDRNL
jgi:integrase